MGQAEDFHAPHSHSLNLSSSRPGTRVCREGSPLRGPGPGGGGGMVPSRPPDLCPRPRGLLCLQRSHCVPAATSTSWTASSSRLWTATGTASASSAVTATRRWPSAASAAERASTARTTSSSETGCRWAEGLLRSAPGKGATPRTPLDPHDNQGRSPESAFLQTPSCSPGRVPWGFSVGGWAGTLAIFQSNEFYESLKRLFKRGPQVCRTLLGSLSLHFGLVFVLK